MEIQRSGDGGPGSSVAFWRDRTSGTPNSDPENSQEEETGGATSGLVAR